MQLATTTWGDRAAERSAVLLHGITGHSATWSRIGPILAAGGFHVIAPDLPGHGHSGPTAETSLSDVVGAVVETVGDRADLLVGHSFGGTLALQALADHAIHLQALVLEDPVVTLSADHAAAVIENEASWWPTTIDDARTRRPGWDDREVVASMSARVQLDVDTARDLWTGNAPWDLTGALGFSHRCAATAVIVPEHSPYISPFAADAIAAVTPPETVIRPPGLGHQVHRDDPGQFMAVVRAVIGAATARGGSG